MSDLTNTVYSDAARQLVGRIDESIREALDSRLGVGAWTLGSLQGRLMVLCGYAGLETYYLDGQPLLKLHPLETATDFADGVYRVIVTRKVERL